MGIGGESNRLMIFHGHPSSPTITPNVNQHITPIVTPLVIHQWDNLPARHLQPNHLQPRNLQPFPIVSHHLQPFPIVCNFSHQNYNHSIYPPSPIIFVKRHTRFIKSDFWIGLRRGLEGKGEMMIVMAKVMMLKMVKMVKMVTILVKMVRIVKPPHHTILNSIPILHTIPHGIGSCC